MKFILIILVMVVFSCNGRKESYMIQGNNIDIQNFLSKTDSLFQISKVTNTNTIKLVGINNPNDFLTGSELVVFINNKVVYLGKFKKEVVLKIPNLEENDIVHLKFVILKEKELYVLENKSVFNWLKDYRFIYYGIFPYNESINRIHFFPQKNRVIN